MIEELEFLIPKTIEGRPESPEEWALRIGLLPDLREWYAIGDRTMPGGERLLIALTYDAARRKAYDVLWVLFDVARQMRAELDSRVRI